MHEMERVALRIGHSIRSGERRSDARRVAAAGARTLGLWLGLAGMLLAGVNLCAQSKPAGEQDNPFPGAAADHQGTNQQGTDQQSTDQQKKQTPEANPAGAGQATPTAKPESDNPFPAEESMAPIIPVAGEPPPPDRNVPRRPQQATDAGRAAPDLDGDPVRSPDGAADAGNDGFSSSRSGLNGMPAENDTEAAPGDSGKHKTREEKIKEDMDTGAFYAEKKNWKAAQSRFAEAFALDKENEDAVWGLAEADRHLQLYKESAEHYRLFLRFDPDGPHSKAARKGLDQVEGQMAGQPKSAGGLDTIQPK